jgi:hypothetical protein
MVMMMRVRVMVMTMDLVWSIPLTRRWIHH